MMQAASSMLVRHWLVVIGCVLIGAIAWGCSGPPAPSTVIRVYERDTFVPMLRDHASAPQEAYYEWKAAQTGQSPDAIRAADQQLSTTRNPFKANSDAVAISRGAAIYNAYCASCHGGNGEGKGPALTHSTPLMNFHRFANRFAVTLHGGAPRAWFKKINEGYTSETANPDGTKNAMPAFKDTLAREQIWLAITYLQTVDAAVTATPASQPHS